MVPYVDDVAVTLNWDAPTEPNGQIVNYKIIYYQVHLISGSTSEELTEFVGNNETFKTLLNLESGMVFAISCMSCS